MINYSMSICLGISYKIIESKTRAKAKCKDQPVSPVPFLFHFNTQIFKAEL